MQQLTGVDGIFLCMDASETSHGVIASLTLFDVPEHDPDAGGAARMRERIRERLDGIPPLRRVITGVPVGVNNAYLHEAPEPLDLDIHVREIKVPAPANDHQLADIVAAASERALPRDRPMWELLVLTGLPEGRIAHLLRAHHGIMDGGSMQVVLDLLSDEPTRQPDPADAPPERGSRVPVKLEVLGRGLVNNALTPVRAAGLAGKAVKFLAQRHTVDGALAIPAFVARMVPGEIGRPIVLVVDKLQAKRGKPKVRQLIRTFDVPQTSFNAKISSRRSFAFSSMPVDDLKALGKPHGMTLNDIVVAVCAGALRRHLINHGGVPDKPLVLSVPITIRSGDEKEVWANYASGFWAFLPTHLEDPIERLKAIHLDIQDGKATFDAMPKDLIRDASRIMWPQSMFSLMYRASDILPDRMGGMFNVVISNVPGPTKRLHLAGAEMVAYWPVGALGPGGGLNIVLQSYVGQLCYGLLACPDLIPDVWELDKHMHESLEELKAALALHGAGSLV